MMHFEVGKAIPEYMGVPEGTRFVLDDSGAMLTVFFRHPTPNEIADYHQDKPLQMAVTYKSGILVMLAKFGGQKWIDAPYNPNIGTKPNLPEIKEGLGLGLTIVLIDTPSGVVKSLRFVSMPTKLSRVLMIDVADMLENPMPIDMYHAAVDNLFRAYTTKELLSIAQEKCRVV